MAEGQRYLQGGQVARLLHVSAKTVARWSKEGKLPHVVTIGGHRRYDPEKIAALAERLAGPEIGGGQ